jgi:hypothetical protein
LYLVTRHSALILRPFPVLKGFELVTVTSSK